MAKAIKVEEKKIETPVAPIVKSEPEQTAVVYMQKEGEKEYKPVMEFAIKPEEKTEEQKIREYIDNHSSNKIDLAPVIKSLYPMPTMHSPAIYLQQNESKRMRGLLTKMKNDGSITIDDSYLKLGSFYYVDGDTKTKYHNIETVKIIASK